MLVKELSASYCAQQAAIPAETIILSPTQMNLQFNVHCTILPLFGTIYLKKDFTSRLQS
jgi:hypothetical protein